MEVRVAYEFFLGLFYRKEVQTEYLDFNLKCIEMVVTEYSAAVALSLSFLLYFRSSMGVMEPRGVHVYPLCWHTPQPGCPHLQSQICQSGPVDTWADPGIRTQTGPNTHLQHSTTALSVLLLTYSNRDLHKIKMTDKPERGSRHISTSCPLGPWPSQISIRLIICGIRWNKSNPGRSSPLTHRFQNYKLTQLLQDSDSPCWFSNMHF